MVKVDYQFPDGEEIKEREFATVAAAKNFIFDVYQCGGSAKIVSFGDENENSK